MPTRKRPKSEIDPQWLKFQAAFSKGRALNTNSVDWRLVTLFLGCLALAVWSLR
jgi:hypothetical protein